jgi:NitT/TauT family transport system substrate-binding protein
MTGGRPARLGRAAGLAAFVVVALASLACRADSGPGAAPLVPLRLAVLGINAGPQQLGIDHGVYARHGIDLQVLHFIGGGPGATVAAASGQVDMGEYGTPILIGIASGLHIKVVGSPAVKANPFELVGRTGIGSVRDLKGKTATSGVLGGGDGHQAILKILRDNGLGTDDVQLVGSGGADAELVLRSGRVDAVITNELTRRKVVDEGRGSLLARAQDYFGHYQHNYVYATDQFIAAHPETVRNYFLATRESLEYARANLDELVDFAASQVMVKKPLIRAYYESQIIQCDLIPTLGGSDSFVSFPDAGRF